MIVKPNIEINPKNKESPQSLLLKVNIQFTRTHICRPTVAYLVERNQNGAPRFTVKQDFTVERINSSCLTNHIAVQLERTIKIVIACR